MNSFAIVRSSEDLARACRDIGDYFSVFQRQRSEAQAPGGLLAIWIDPQMTSTPPEVITVGEGPSAERQIPVRETTSLGGVWTLCWLDTCAEEREEGLTRRDLLAALDRENGYAGQFIPVYHRQTPQSSVTEEVELLQQRFPESARSPLYLDCATGVLAPLRAVTECV